MTPGQEALIEAMRLEQARIYSATVREHREAEEIARRREIAASVNANEEARVIQLHERRTAS